MPRHPEPPTNFASVKLPIARWNRPWFRIHQAIHTALFFGRSGSNRFDAPAGEFGVLYVGADPYCSFIETFGHATGVHAVTEGELRARNLSTVQSSRQLTLVDLTGKGLARIGADAALTAGDDHGLAHRWAKAIHDHPQRPDGILYRARHDPSRSAAAIFDRSGPMLTVSSSWNLLDPSQATILGEILDRYQFGLMP